MREPRTEADYPRTPSGVRLLGRELWEWLPEAYQMSHAKLAEVIVQVEAEAAQGALDEVKVLRMALEASKSTLEAVFRANLTLEPRLRGLLVATYAEQRVALQDRGADRPFDSTWDDRHARAALRANGDPAEYARRLAEVEDRGADR